MCWCWFPKVVISLKVVFFLFFLLTSCNLNFPNASSASLQTILVSPLSFSNHFFFLACTILLKNSNKITSFFTAPLISLHSILIGNWFWHLALVWQNPEPMPGLQLGQLASSLNFHQITDQKDGSRIGVIFFMPHLLQRVLHISTPVKKWFTDYSLHFRSIHKYHIVKGRMYKWTVFFLLCECCCLPI